MRQSARARRLSVRVFRNGGVEIVVPPRTSPRRVSAFVSEHREWIERQRRRAVPGRLAAAAEALVADGDRRAVALQRRCAAPDAVRLRETRHGVRAAAQRPAGRIASGCGCCWCRWLVGHARRSASSRRCARWRRRWRWKPARLQVRCQRTRWGSCSRRGTISLNVCLLFQRPEVLRYLMIHELAHLRHMNHSARFWAEVARHEPDWKALDRELLQGWRRVPSWMFR